MNYMVHTFFLSLNSRSFKEKIYIISRRFYSGYMIVKIRLYLTLQQVSLLPHDTRLMCFNFTHNLMNIVGSIDLHNSLQTFSIRILWQLRTVKATLVLTPPPREERCSALAEETIKWRTMLYKIKTIPGVYCSSSSFEYIFPTILKTVHSDKSNSNRNS